VFYSYKNLYNIPPGKKKTGGKMQANRFSKLLKQQFRKSSVHHLHTAAVKEKNPITGSVQVNRL